MSTRNASNYYTVIVPEVSRGTQVKDLATGVMLPDPCDIDDASIIKERSHKRATIKDRAGAKIKTGTKYNVKLSGELTSTHEILLKAFTQDSTSPYTLPDEVPATDLTYNIYRIYNVGASVYYDVALGCHCDSLKLSGNETDKITYEASFSAVASRFEIHSTSGDALTNVPARADLAGYFLFGNATASLANSATKLNSFSIDLSKSMVSDERRFQNTLTMANDLFTAIGGKLKFQTIWDSVNDSAMVNKLNDGSAYTSTITLVSSDSSPKTWAFVMYGTLESIKRPDEERNLFVSDQEYNLAYDASLHEPITITVS